MKLKPLLLTLFVSTLSAPAQLVVSEFLAINDSIAQDEDGAFSDWIEIHNPTSDPVALEGFILTDDPEFDLSEPETFWRLPAGELAEDGYLLIYASGKDRSAPEGEWHTNFSLGASEYLALLTPDGATILTEFGPDYPEQRTDISFGLSGGAAGERQYFKAPTPGDVNDGGIDGFVADTKFSVNRGFYEEPFELEITTATEDAEIYYTTDGRTPSKGNIITGPVGELYDGPITIDTTAVIRAIAVKKDHESTNVDTHTFVFVQDVVHQPAEQEGWPNEWLGNGGQGSFPADYGMDPEVTEDPAYKEIVDDALLALPTLSLVTDPDHLFDTQDGIYQRPQQSGINWERPVSAELIHPDGTRGFQIDAGVRIQGGHTREPAKNPKHSFRLLFKKEYGAGRLNYPLFDEESATTEFDTIILRGAGNQSWLHHNEFLGDNRGRAQYVRDQWAKDTQRAMGHPAAHNRMVHLYLNGLYWGLYNPTERPTGGFGESYLGGSKDDYDALNSGDPKDGDKAAFNEMLGRARQDLTVQSNYDALAEVLDIKGFTDYMILNHYGGNVDWDHHNWYAMRNRNGGLWRFFAWDSEFFFTNLDDNVITKDNRNNPSEIFQALAQNEDYVRFLGDRLHEHFYNDGLLTEASVLERWEKRSADVELALVGESARWGDYRRDVHRRGGPFLLMTRDDSWVAERNRLLNDYFPSRGEEVIKQYRRLKLYPTINAPEFDQHGGSVVADAEVTVSIPGGIFAPRGDIFLTMDGSDPRLEDGTPNPAAIKLAPGAGFTVEVSGTVKARHLFDDEDWSALNEAYFIIGQSADNSNLEVTEIHYDPAEGKDYEFLELRNTSDQRVDLSGLRFSNGIDFELPEGQPYFLEAGAYGLLVSNREAFIAHYGTSAQGMVVGEFANETNLKNGGERLTLLDRKGSILWTLRYDNAEPWPPLSEGHSLVFAGGDPSSPQAWTSSAKQGGSPGAEDIGGASPGINFTSWSEEHFDASELADSDISGSDGNPDNDAWPNFAEYALGLDPKTPDSAPVIWVDPTSIGYQYAPLATQATVSLEISSDLLVWEKATLTLLSETPSESGSTSLVHRSLPGGEDSRYVRLRVTLDEE